MLDQAHDFLMASGKLQVLCYKEEIEAALRTPGVDGFQLLDLHDFPGQGTALVGVMNALWDSKGYVAPEQFRRFCNTTVPLARLGSRVWTTGQTLTADVEVAHFGPRPLRQSTALWKLLRGDGLEVAAGEFPATDLPVAGRIALGQISIPLAGLNAPQMYTLTIGLKGTPFENDWNLWVYPQRVATTAPSDVLMTSDLQEATGRLRNGGKVLLLPGARLGPENPQGSFTPVFWNRQWFPKQACQTLGLLCDPRHPAFAQFPTDFFSDWQWEDLVNSSRAMVLDGFPRDLHPIVQVIDDWNTNRRLAMVFECRIGKGKLLVCSADLVGRLERRPVARQLLSSLLTYVRSARFDPKTEVSPDQVRALMSVPVR
ncbi:MAG TPA: hypothetical protein VIM11_18390 [Tepidisphaeraceae bacterium]